MFYRSEDDKGSIKSPDLPKIKSPDLPKIKSPDPIAVADCQKIISPAKSLKSKPSTDTVSPSSAKGSCFKSKENPLRGIPQECKNWKVDETEAERI